MKPPRENRNSGFSLPRRLLYGSIVSLAALLLFFCLLEGSLRIFGYGHSPKFHRTVGEPDGTEWVRENRDFTAAWFTSELVRRPHPFRVRSPKPPSIYRVVILGSSAAMGDPEASFSLARTLERMLRNAYPEINFEVINAAITAVNSHVVRQVAADCAELEPDLFIVYEGHNEVIGPFGPASVFAPFFRSTTAIDLTVALRQSRTGQLLGDLADRFGRHTGMRDEWGGMGMFLEHTFARDDPRLQVVRKHFRNNLQSIVRSARSAGAPTLLCTVPGNLKDFAPFLPQHRAGLLDEQRQRWKTAVEAGDRALAGGNRSAAERHYRTAWQIDEQHAGLAFRLGRVCLADSRGQEAKHLLTRARDLDTLRFRADSRLNETVREVARQARNDVELVDLASLLASLSPAGIPGNEFLYEHVHLTLLGTYEVSRILFERIGADLVRTGWTDRKQSQSLSYEELRRQLAYTAYEQAMIIRTLLRRFRAPPFTSQLDHSIRLGTWEERKVNADRLLQQPGSHDALARLYEEALAAHPDDWVLARNYGMALVAFNRPAQAIYWLEKARSVIDDDPDTLFALATAFRADGQPAQAERIFAQLREFESRYPGLPRSDS